MFFREITHKGSALENTNRPSTTENFIKEVSQKISIFKFFETLAILFFSSSVALGLTIIFRNTPLAIVLIYLNI